VAGSLFSCDRVNARHVWSIGDAVTNLVTLLIMGQGAQPQHYWSRVGHDLLSWRVMSVTSLDLANECRVTKCRLNQPSRPNA